MLPTIVKPGCSVTSWSNNGLQHIECSEDLMKLVDIYWRWISLLTGCQRWGIARAKQAFINIYNDTLVICKIVNGLFNNLCCLYSPNKLKVTLNNNLFLNVNLIYLENAR